MRRIHEWLDSYASCHQHPTNRALHWVCVPLITWSVIALLWLIPVLHAFMRPGAWAVIAMFAAFLFYQRLSRPMAWIMAGVFIVLALITAGLHHVLGFTGLLTLALVVFVAAWIGQFVGHRIEGRRPAFFTEVTQLLIGPTWLVSKVLDRFDVTY